MFTRPVALAVIALAPLSLVACSKQSSPESADSSSDAAHAHADNDNHDHDTASDHTEEPTMSSDSHEGHDDHTDHADHAESASGATPEAFAVTITQALIDGDTKTVIANIKAVNLPEGWQQMVMPMFLDLKGRNLEGKIRPRSDFTNEELSWPDQTPEPYKAVEQILFISYEADSESGSNTFPLIFEDGQWKLLLAQ